VDKRTTLVSGCREDGRNQTASGKERGKSGNGLLPEEICGRTSEIINDV